MIEDIENVVEASSSNRKIEIVLDCVSSQSTISDIAKLVSPSGVVAILLPFKMGNGFESKELYMDTIPDDMNPLPKGVRIAGVRNLKFEEVGGECV
jgi:threonine dehydrogenase-like Zn-dependent dehydrogenase